MSNHTAIAVDVAKAVFELALSDRPGHVNGPEPLPEESRYPLLSGASEALGRNDTSATPMSDLFGGGIP